MHGPPIHDEANSYSQFCEHASKRYSKFHSRKLTFTWYKEESFLLSVMINLETQAKYKNRRDEKFLYPKFSVPFSGTKLRKMTKRNPKQACAINSN
jgi:hypothetical protein